MALVQIAAPAEEPLTVEEAKAHLRVDHDAEDALIQSLIVTSRLHIEAALSLALITQDWSWRLDDWPDDRAVVLPVGPVQSIEAVRITQPSGDIETLDAAFYDLDGAGVPPRLLARSGVWPAPGIRAQGIEIAFTAGFGDEGADVPAPIRQALLLLIGHWYENREPAPLGQSPAPIPGTVSALLSPYRVVRL